MVSRVIAIRKQLQLAEAKREELELQLRTREIKGQPVDTRLLGEQQRRRDVLVNNVIPQLREDMEKALLEEQQEKEEKEKFEERLKTATREDLEQMMKAMEALKPVPARIVNADNLRFEVGMMQFEAALARMLQEGKITREEWDRQYRELNLTPPKVVPNIFSFTAEDILNRPRFKGVLDELQRQIRDAPNKTVREEKEKELQRLRTNVRQWLNRNPDGWRKVIGGTLEIVPTVTAGHRATTAAIKEEYVWTDPWIEKSMEYMQDQLQKMERAAKQLQSSDEIRSLAQRYDFPLSAYSPTSPNPMDNVVLTIEMLKELSNYIRSERLMGRVPVAKIEEEKARERFRRLALERGERPIPSLERPSREVVPREIRPEERVSRALLPPTMMFEVPTPQLLLRAATDVESAGHLDELSKLMSASLASIEEHPLPQVETAMTKAKREAERKIRLARRQVIIARVDATRHAYADAADRALRKLEMLGGLAEPQRKRLQELMRAPKPKKEKKAKRKG